MYIQKVRWNAWYPQDKVLCYSAVNRGYVIHMTRAPYIAEYGGKEQLVPRGSLIVYDLCRPLKIRASGPKIGLDSIEFSFSERDSIIYKEARLTEYAGRPYPAVNIPMWSSFFCDIAYEKRLDDYYTGRVLDLLVKRICYKFRESVKIEETRKSPYSELLKTIRSEIAAEPEFKWEPGDTAQRLNISLSHFQHLYKQQFNVSFMKDVIAHRIEKACTLISKSKPAEAVASLCGYKDVSFFSRQFKACTGLTPKEFREMHRS